MFFDNQQQAGTVIDDAVSDWRGIPDDDLRDITQPERGAIAELHDAARKVIRARNRADLSHGEALIGSIDKTARPDHCRIPGGFDHGIQRDAEGVQPRRVHQNLIFLVTLTPDRDVRHTSHRHEAGTERPQCQLAQLGLRHRF